MREARDRNAVTSTSLLVRDVWLISVLGYNVERADALASLRWRTSQRRRESDIPGDRRDLLALEAMRPLMTLNGLSLSPA